MPRGNRERSANTRSLSFACSPSAVCRRNILNFFVIPHKDTFLFRFLKPQAETVFSTLRFVQNRRARNFSSSFHHTPLYPPRIRPLLSPTRHPPRLRIAPHTTPSHCSTHPPYARITPPRRTSTFLTTPPHRSSPPLSYLGLPRPTQRTTYTPPRRPRRPSLAPTTKKRGTSLTEAPLGFRYSELITRVDRK